MLLEYNGMWPIQILRDLKLPKNWGLYQAIDVIDGTTFVNPGPAREGYCAVVDIDDGKVEVEMIGPATA